MVHNTYEEKRKGDFEIMSVQDAHPTVPEFHYLGNCIQRRPVFWGGWVFLVFCLFQMKYSQEEADLTKDRPK